MNSKLILTLLFLGLMVSASADLGPPNIQAVCRVTLSNGKVVEGMITLGHGGWGLWMNGFYLEHYEQGEYKYEWTEFFTLDSKSFIKKDSSYSFDRQSYPDCRRIKFLECF